MAKAIDEQLSGVLRAEGVEDPALGSISGDDMRQIQINAQVRGGPRFAAYIARLKWVLTINRSTMPYWTSDNPITRYNPHPESLRSNLGLDDRGIQGVLPARRLDRCVSAILKSTQGCLKCGPRATYNL